MNTDPGWGPALILGLKSLIPFSARRLRRHRPAITALRAFLVRQVAYLAAIVGVLGGLESAAGEPDLLPWILLGSYALLAAGLALWLTHRPPVRRAGEDADRIGPIMVHMYLLMAVSLGPALVAFVGVFLGGGLIMYLAGLLWTLLLLFLFALPTEEWAGRFGSRLRPPASGRDIWAALLDPTPPGAGERT